MEDDRADSLSAVMAFGWRAPLDRCRTIKTDVETIDKGGWVPLERVAGRTSPSSIKMSDSSGSTWKVSAGEKATPQPPAGAYSTTPSSEMVRLNR
ncbi:MAG: hypothetical protein R2706_13390 [Acidimicrobiales bacterium]